jgi:hypothetical protein
MDIERKKKQKARYEAALLDAERHSVHATSGPLKGRETFLGSSRCHNQSAFLALVQ